MRPIKCAYNGMHKKSGERYEYRSFHRAFFCPRGFRNEMNRIVFCAGILCLYAIKRIHFADAKKYECK